MHDINKMICLITQLIVIKTHRLVLKLQLWWAKRKRNNKGRTHYNNGTDFKALPKGWESGEDPWDYDR